MQAHDSKGGNTQKHIRQMVANGNVFVNGRPILSFLFTVRSALIKPSRTNFYKGSVNKPVTMPNNDYKPGKSFWPAITKTYQTVKNSNGLMIFSITRSTLTDYEYPKKHFQSHYVRGHEQMHKVLNRMEKDFKRKGIKHNPYLD